MREFGHRISRVRLGLSGFAAFAECEQAQHGQQMVGTGTKAGVFTADDQAEGV